MRVAYKGFYFELENDCFRRRIQVLAWLFILLGVGLRLYIYFVQSFMSGLLGGKKDEKWIFK